MHNAKLKKTLCSFLALSIASAAALFLDPATVRADELDPETTEIAAPEEVGEEEALPEETEVITEETEEAIPSEAEESEETEASDVISTEVAEETDGSSDELALVDEVENTELTVIEEDQTDDEIVDVAEVDPDVTEVEVEEEPEIVYTEDGEYLLVDEYIPTDDSGTDIEYITDDEIDPCYANTAPTATLGLTGYNGTLYNLVLNRTQRFAAGTLSTSEFMFTTSELGISDNFYTASDLGVSSVYNGSGVTDAAYYALLDRLNGDSNLIIDKLIYDLPFDTFWFDKTQGVGYGITNIGIYQDRSNGEYLLKVTGTLNMYFAVESCYAADSDYDSLTANAISRARTAKANAQAIVNSYANLSDVAKLTAYKTAICNLTSYDHAALNSSVYGESYQLLNVFDNNSSTNVVCEGYAKAFKYLCDLSTFSNNVSCLLIPGYMDQPTDDNGHMWNIVTINGNNYLVDVTNVDSNTIGQGDYLFLKNPTSGNVSSGYTYVIRGTSVKYIYDTDARTVYTTAQLTITNHGWVRGNTGWWYRNIDGTFPKSKWQSIDGKWYYFDGVGIMATGWTKVGTSWYYLGTDGVMKTGWQKISNKWYYFNGSGAMLTGWQKISGTWYYFDGLGAMLTGWQKISGSWYYFDGLGKMQTGWKSISGNWYYFDGLGKMQTGWKNIGGKWYFFNSLGVMARNTTVGGYRLGADGAMIG